MADFLIPDTPNVNLVMTKIEQEDDVEASFVNRYFSQLLENDAYLNQKSTSAASVKTAIFKAGSWSGEVPYTQTIQVAGISSSDQPHVDPYIPEGSTADQSKGIRMAAACVDQVFTGDGILRGVCLEKRPENDIPILIKGA